MGVVLAVAVGGALGSLLRYFLAGAIQPSWWPGFPFGIFVVNISGGLAMGAIVALARSSSSCRRTTGLPHRRHPGRLHHFSTFSLDSALL